MSLEFWLRLANGNELKTAKTKLWSTNAHIRVLRLRVNQKCKLWTNHPSLVSISKENTKVKTKKINNIQLSLFFIDIYLRL